MGLGQGLPTRQRGDASHQVLFLVHHALHTTKSQSTFLLEPCDFFAYPTCLTTFKQYHALSLLVPHLTH